MNTSTTDNSLYGQSQSNLVSRAAGKYQSLDRAKSFASTVPGTRTDHLEKKCIKKALSILKMPAGTAALDIPCGAGRILPLLKQAGFQVTGADISASMLEQSKDAGYENLKIADVFETGFADKQFDLVISHRLFQYFSEAQDRRKALSELHRISKGPVIVSFSCDCAFDALMYKIRRFFGITRLRSCRPVSFSDFAQDARSVGLEVVKWLATRPLISKRWYAIMSPLTAIDAVSDKRASFVSDILRPVLLRTSIATAVLALLIFLI